MFATIAYSSAPFIKPITVEEFIAHIDQLDGKTVKVTGYLGECESLSCTLYRNKAESEEVDRAMSVIRAALEKGATDVSGLPLPNHPSVSIGPGSQFSFLTCVLDATQTNLWSLPVRRQINVVHETFHASIEWVIFNPLLFGRHPRPTSQSGGQDVCNGGVS
ncbi:hypothetical protein [Blastomonas aquatica]|uniref:hypothetical protein n=1 Tax=Blastomonas aquatica TaxID=1510276 RepID=UPI00360872CB